MDKRKSRILYWIGNRAGAGEDPEEVKELEEEGHLEGLDRTTTNGHCTGRSNDDYDDYNSPHPESKEAAASFDSEPEIPFVLELRFSGLPPISKR